LDDLLQSATSVPLRAGSLTGLLGIAIEWGFTNALNIGGGMYLTIVFLIVILKVGKESSD
ncbi:MAG: hypothetical protein MK198_05490, partial [Gracilimonas sp.]|uniref:hypothetical protein n=1 Tax=Gracilimonas sp. TaxID=1974203 RepID=UPI003750FED2|nr:hypothetical protein [Gracilimonas sp.]